MKEISCKVIEDLIPLVEDGIASEESVSLVRNHIENCKSCKVLVEGVELSDKVEVDLKDEKIIRDIKRKLVRSQGLILVFGTILGIGLTYTIGMFYNILLIPLLGGLSYGFLKEKWYLTPLAIVILSYIWQLGQSLVLGYFTWQIFYGALIMTGIYGGLALLGVIIAYLLKYSLGKGDANYEK